jgi:hypothetical protein
MENNQASLKWRVMRSLAIIKRDGLVVSFKGHPFFINTKSSVSFVLKNKNGDEFTVQADRSRSDSDGCKTIVSRAKKISLLVPDKCPAAVLKTVIMTELKHRALGALQEERFFDEATRRLAVIKKTSIKRIYKSKESEDRRGVDFWIVFKKKIQVPLNIKSSTRFQNLHAEAHANIPSLVFHSGDPKLLQKLEIICETYKKGIISHL